MPVLVDMPLHVIEGAIFKQILCKDIPGWKCKQGSGRGEEWEMEWAKERKKQKNQ